MPAEGYWSYEACRRLWKTLLKGVGGALSTASPEARAAGAVLDRAFGASVPPISAVFDVCASDWFYADIASRPAWVRYREQTAPCARMIRPRE
jgi:hypothetical protein